MLNPAADLVHELISVVLQLLAQLSLYFPVVFAPFSQQLFDKYVEILKDDGMVEVNEFTGDQDFKNYLFE